MGELITVIDPDDPRLVDYRRLNDQAVRRAQEGSEFFMGEGFVAIDRMIDSGHALRSVLLAPNRVARFTPQLDVAALDGVPVFVADDEVMKAIVGFDIHRGVLSSAFRKPLVSVADLAASSSRLVVLEGLNDNENVGAIARAARAFGVDGLVLSPTCTDPYYRRSVRVSMGEILHLRLARPTAAEWPAAIDVVHEAGFESWAMTPASDAIDLWAAEVPDRLAILVGAEGPGLSDEAMRLATTRVRIPIEPSVDSINVGHATAVTLAAVRRPSADRSAPRR